jgi:tetratricopeptide (TPR) repeat protein
MSFRFWRRIRIAPGVTLNLSKSGGSLSFGPRGAKFTIGPHGKRVTAGIPGTGLFYTTKLGGGSVGTGKSRQTIPTEERLSLGFFKRLVTPDDEAAFVDGCRELALGNEEEAYAHLQKAVHFPDGAFLAGFLALKLGKPAEAAHFLASAAGAQEKLGRLFGKYGLSATMALAITDEVAAAVSCDREGALLGLVEAYQAQGRVNEAIQCLETLRRLHPDDPVIRLSLCELLLERDGDTKEAAKRVVHLTQRIENESAVHAALLLYKARALRKLGLSEAAKEALTIALRRKKGRGEELLRAIRYERALVFEDIGRKAQARRELERLYAEAPDYADVADRLGI